MNIQVNDYNDFQDMVANVGVPTFVYYVCNNSGSPTDVTGCWALYDRSHAVSSNSTGSTPPTETQFLTDFPGAVKLVYGILSVSAS